MRVNLLQGTYTPLTHAHAGRTQADEADTSPLRGLAQLIARALAIMKWSFATTDEKREAEGYAVGGHRRSRGRVALVPRARALA
jgi:hypothetical protein